MRTPDGTEFYIRDQYGNKFNEYMISQVEDGAKTLMQCYIEIKPDTRYSIHCEAPPRHDASRAKFSVDSKYLGGHTVSKGRHRNSHRNGLKFSPVQLTDNENDCLLDEEVLNKLGEMEIKLTDGIEGKRRVDKQEFEEGIREREASQNETPESAKILESTKKFEIAARTSFKPDKRGKGNKRRNRHRSNSNFSSGSQPFANRNVRQQSFGHFNENHNQQPLSPSYSSSDQRAPFQFSARANDFNNPQFNSHQPPQLQKFEFKHQYQLPRYDDRYDRPHSRPMKVINSFRADKDLQSYPVKFFYRTKASLLLLGIDTKEEDDRAGDESMRSPNKTYLGRHEIDVKDEKDEIQAAIGLGKRKARHSEDGNGDRDGNHNAHEKDDRSQKIFNVDHEEDDEVVEVRPVKKKARLFHGSTLETAIDLTGD